MDNLAGALETKRWETSIPKTACPGIQEPIRPMGIQPRTKSKIDRPLTTQRRTTASPQTGRYAEKAQQKLLINNSHNNDITAQKTFLYQELRMQAARQSRQCQNTNQSNISHKRNRSHPCPRQTNPSRIYQSNNITDPNKMQKRSKTINIR